MKQKLISWAIINFFSFVFLFFVSPVSAATVVINEFLSHPSSGNDWIELYNLTDQSIIIDNFKLVDTTSTMVTLSGSIDGKNFKVFEVTNRLNNAGDTITLKDQSDAILDTYPYDSDPGSDISIGRNPDGEGGFVSLITVTKGSANSPALPTVTPTPTEVPTPTNSPTPTKTPTPTPTNKPTATPKVTQAPSSPPTVPKMVVEESFEEEKEDFGPTAILGEMVTASPSVVPTEVTPKPEKSFFNFPTLSIGIGFIFLAVSGILAFRSYKKSQGYDYR